jgi:capsid protein
MTEEIQVGPDKVMALIRSGDPSAPGPTLRVVQGQLPVAELGAYIEGRIKLYCAMLGIDPSAFLRVNTAVTVSARMFAEATRAEMRGRMRPTLLRLERDIARLVGWVVSTTGAVQMPWRELSVDVRWQDWTPSPDPVADASAQRMRMQLGLSSPVDEVAMAGGLSRSAALRKVQDNLAEARGLGLIPGYQEPATAAADKAEDATEPADDNGADPADSTEEGDK